jgi:hypothetical protein
MNAKPIAVAVLLLGLSSAAFAQSFEDQVAAGSADISRQAQESRQRFALARTIDCPTPPKDARLGDGLRFYTGFGEHPATKIQPDDTAARLDDYRRSYIEGATYHYDAWSCDTQDYYFTFDAAGLQKASPSDKTRPVKGHARIETRGQVDWEGDLDCVANF